MRPHLDDVSEGQRPSAGWTNELKDIACRETGVDAAFSDSSGTVAMPASKKTLDLYELTGDPSLDSEWNEYTAPAKPVRITLASGNKRYTRDDTAPTEYVGFISQPRSSGSNPSAPTAKSGDRVYTYVRWGNREVVGSAGTICMRCKALLKGALSSGDATCTVDNVVPMDEGASPVASSSTELTVSNTMAFAGADNANCRIEWDSDAGAWELYVVKHITQTIQTTYQIDGPNKKFQKKTRTVVGMFDDAETAWTDVHTGEVCPP